jgi:cytoskeletal protein CcmA (bactofilin family)
MIDMKQIKENVANRIKTTQTQEPPAADLPIRESKPLTPAKESSAAIGASIRIKGDVSGDENLIIQGQVEGTIKVQGHNVTISKTGKVKANIEANQIIVEGELQGDMFGEEKVIIRETGNVHGNIVAPRVTLEDGALFKGSIEMEPRQKGMSASKPANPTVTSTYTTEQKSA